MDSLTNLKVGFKDQADLIDRLKEKINKFHRDLQFCLEELGLWCAYKVGDDPTTLLPCVARIAILIRLVNGF